MIKIFNYKRETRQNPFIGFTSFQHLNNEELYSDLIVKPENNLTETEHVECYPIPSYVKQKGRAEGYYPECSVAYYRVIWKDFEPKEGQFNFSLIQEVLDRAKEAGQTVMFRLLTHSTRESDDVPDWLKTYIKCPARPAGKRVKDSPSDPRFIDFFIKAVVAFAKEFDENPVLDVMDISFPGSWGEGSSIDLFSDADIKKLVDAYTENFKNTKLIGQLIADKFVKYANETKPVGWRADGVGHPVVTNELIPKTNDYLKDVWKTAPISFEAYWWLGEWQRKGWDIDAFFNRMLECHASTFNAKSLPIPIEWKEKMDNFNAKLGYHFGIKRAEFNERAHQNSKFRLNLNIFNYGVAPIYNKIPVKIRLQGQSRDFTFEQKTDITKWLLNDNPVEIELDLSGIPAEKYKLQVGIFNQKNILELCMDAPFDGKFYTIGQIEIYK
ncbi:MAG: DUF4832 domain-containing protein [Clostridia bacterium]|nr:DUF4832 domain-containing protein [Clostridia bacterium]